MERRYFWEVIVLDYLLYVLVALLGILFRYNLGLAQACKVVGKSISDTDSNTGFQDAVTPPNSTNLTLVTWIAIFGALGYAVYEFGWGTGGIALAALFVVTVLAGATFVPKPESVHYLKRIHGSMAKRFADFQKNGDVIRADSIRVLIDKVEVEYAESLK